MIEFIMLIVLSIIFGIVGEIIAMINYRKYNGKEEQLELVSCEFFIFFVLSTMLGIYLAVNEQPENTTMIILSLVPLVTFFILPIYCIISNNINKTKKSEEYNVKV